MRSVVPLHRFADPVPLGRIDAQSLDMLRLVLRGGSVVDWYRLHFDHRDDIAAFIRLNELDLESPSDRRHLDALHEQASEFLRVHLKYRRLPEPVARADLFELFEYASGRGRRAYRLYACMTLKVMHIIHYVAAHELLSMLPISNAEVAVLLRGKVERVVRGFIERGFPIVEFSGNTKSADSIISKLLAKKETQSAQVFDKLRFRLVTQRLEDVPSLLVGLVRELFPFNYLVPNQSDNSLLDLDRLLIRAGNLQAIRGQQGQQIDLNEPANAGFAIEHSNEFSGPGYKVAHFVSEVPVRIDKVIPMRSPRLRGRGPVVFGTVEFQVVDQRTAQNNERGENRHTLYKNRQRQRVKERLERGKRRKAGSSSS